MPNPAHETYVENILARYRRADADTLADGREWYAIARAEARAIAREHGVTFRQAAGLLAACSINQGWKGNVTIARRAAASGPVGLPATVAFCTRILAGEPPTKVLASGQKIVRFYRNIVGDDDAVTIDRWAARAAGSETVGARYDAIAQSYRAAAAIVGETPAALQAIVWIQIRGSAT